MKNIVWLASYPKSGNTWCRIFLENLRSQATESPISINQLSVQPENRRSYIEEALGLKSSNFQEEELEALLPEVYQHWSDHSEQLLCIKTHRAYSQLPNGKPFFPSTASHGTIYLVRNPLDVSVSFAHHIHKSSSAAIEKMNDHGLKVPYAPQKYSFLIPQTLGSWSDNVESWLNQQEIPVLLIRYEDMKLEPVATFRKIAKFMKLYTSEEALATAIENSSFKQLKSQEKQGGFREKRPGSVSFFRKGEIGSWREQLTTAEVDRIIQQHGATMKLLGYLSEDGKPVY